MELLSTARDADWGAATRLAEAIPRAGGRPIWLSTRPLAPDVDAPWIRVAVLGGWAVFRDPVEGPPAGAFLWARPTVAIGRERELVDLLEATDALAPARRAERWRTRHLARLDTLIVEPAGASGILEPALERRGLAPRVVRVPAGEW